MSVLDRLHMPRHLSSRVWLLTIPTALISFERQQAMPKLPIGILRFAGLPLIAGGLAFAVWAWRNQDAAIRYNGPGARLSAQPATLAGLLVVAGAGLLLRSTALTLYAVAIAAAAATETIDIDEPRPGALLGRRGED
jgi:protein-S-isoprenylcysteine O-methyltransferase Ste14